MRNLLMQQKNGFVVYFVLDYLIDARTSYLNLFWDNDIVLHCYECCLYLLY